MFNQLLASGKITKQPSTCFAPYEKIRHYQSPDWKRSLKILSGKNKSGLAFCTDDEDC